MRATCTADDVLPFTTTARCFPTFLSRFELEFRPWCERSQAREFGAGALFQISDDLAYEMVQLIGSFSLRDPGLLRQPRCQPRLLHLDFMLSAPICNGPCGSGGSENYAIEFKPVPSAVIAASFR